MNRHGHRIRSKHLTNASKQDQDLAKVEGVGEPFKWYALFAPADLERKLRALRALRAAHGEIAELDRPVGLCVRFALLAHRFGQTHRAKERSRTNRVGASCGTYQIGGVAPAPVSMLFP